MKIDVFTNEGTEIYYDETLKSIIATYNGVVKYDDWVAHLEYALDLIKKHSTTKWLSDSRNAKVIAVNNQKYFEEVFVPATHNATTMQYVATVLSKDAFNEFGTRQLMNNYKSQVGEVAANNQYFKTMEEAKEWLESR
ncbi:hypothetical protein ACE193_03895 [Bernardetia sp. OM2101]|uniref:hypothetical protein n=1 Tax=Bernardetia sp. OM2101 TaxID=3344876 RepID=UPI0035D0A8B7